MQSLKLKQRPLDYNALTVLENAARLLGINLSNTSLEAVSYLPDFPSMSSLAVAFSEWGIETAALKLRKEDLQELSLPAIAHTFKNNGHFVIITHVCDDRITYHDTEKGWRTESVEKFVPQWSGVVLLMEAKENAGDPRYDEHRKQERLGTWRKYAGMGLGVLVTAGTLLFLQSWYGALLWVTFLTGAVVSGLIVASELGSNFTAALCGAGKKIDCQKVLDSPAATLFGWLKMSDIGLVWFSAGWLSLIVASMSGTVNPVLGVLAVLSICSVAYVPFSLGYQWLKIKMWCALCLAVQAVLVINAGVLLSYSDEASRIFSNPNGIYIVVAVFAVVTAIWLFVKPLLSRNAEVGRLKKDVSRFKNDTDLFQKLLHTSKKVEVFELPHEVRIGNTQAPLHLVMATNPYCKPCANAHKLLESLIAQSPDRVYVTLRFTADPDDLENKAGIVAKHFISLRPSQHQEALRDWFQINDYETWAARYPAVITGDAISILREHHNWCSWVNVTHTPTLFVNGYRTPTQYNFDEVIFHLKYLELETAAENNYQL
jgi:uncharacterized membrane protein